MKIEKLRTVFERFLEIVVIVLMVALAIEVTIGIVYRSLGRSLVWYDEIAAVLLAWLTFYGAALAALKRAHIGFPGLVRAFPPVPRLCAVIFAEFCVFAFFAILGWTGYSVLEVLQTDHLVSLPTIQVAWTQSVIPISAVLLIVAEALSLPAVLAAARGRGGALDGDLAEKRH